MSPDPMGRVLRRGGVGMLLLLLVAAPAGWFASGNAGLVGGVSGTLVPAIFFGATIAAGVFGRDATPGTFGALVLGSWLVKLVVLMAALAWLRGLAEFDRVVFFVTLLTGTTGLLFTEWHMVTRSSQLYVVPREETPKK